MFRSVSHIYAQVIDDMTGTTIAVGGQHRAGAEVRVRRHDARRERRGAKALGRTIAERLKEKGITRVVFDRGGFLYHGRIKAVADAAREAGLEF